MYKIIFVHNFMMIGLTFKEREEDYESCWWNKVIPNYLTKENLKAISQHLRITEEQVKSLVLDSLYELGMYNLSFEEEFKEHHIIWFSLIRTCIEEQDPKKRWEKAKSLICDAVLDFSDRNLMNEVYSIVRDSRIATEIIPSKSGRIAYIGVGERTFVECCIRTVILFNTQDFDVPPDVFIDNWKQSFRPNLCYWHFHREVVRFEIELRDGTLKEKFVYGLDKEDWFFLRRDEKYQPSCFLFQTKDGTMKEGDIGAFIRGNFPWVAGIILQDNIRDVIPLLFQYLTLDSIKSWLENITGRKYGSKRQMEEALQSGWVAALLHNIAKAFFPEYESDVVGYRSTYAPQWEPENRLLNLQKLRVELGDFYFSKLPKEERVEAFEKFAPALGFNILNYESFRDLIEEWKWNQEFDRIQSFVQTLKKLYAPSKLKKINTYRARVLLCLKVIKVRLETDCTGIKPACAIVSENLKKGKTKISLIANLTPKYIRARFYEVIREENRNNKFNLNNIDDLRVYPSR